MNADGSNVVNVTNSVVAEYQPTWSPDGTQLAFISFDDGNGDIFVIDLDGSNRTNLTNHPERDDMPSWAR
jgi:TolB protein